MKPRRAHPVIILLVVLLCLAPGVQAQDGVATDKAALVALYNATDGANWTPNTNWTSTEQLSAWHGVTTNSDGRVTRLVLNDNGLDGTLPAALGDLSALEYLDLQNNALSGALPAELADLTNLEELLLNESRALTGPLPDGLRELSGLETVNIEKTELCAPEDDAFQTWLDTITFSGLICPPAEQSVIDVAVFYTPAARENAGGTDVTATLIDLMVAETNAAYQASRANQRIKLVAVEEVVGYTESNNLSIDLVRLRSPSDGHMDEVHDIRDAVAADIVLLITVTAGSRGVAFQMFVPSTSSEAEAFGVVSTESTDTFAHELGHIMGLQHDRYQVCKDNCSHVTRFPYAFGYENQRALEPSPPDTAFWRTIMAYPSQCGRCSGILRFSNPDQIYPYPGGDPLGKAGLEPAPGADGPSDAVRMLNRTRGYVANFRTPRAITVSFDAQTYTATEGGTSATVTVSLSDEPGRAIDISLTATSANGAAASDYIVPSSVPFAANDTEQTFTVTAVDDAVDDDGETVALTLGSLLPGGVSAGSTTTATVTLTDNDPDPGAPSVLSVSLTSDPGGGYATGEEIEGTVRFNKRVTVTGTPQLGLTVGSVTRQASYEGGAREVVTFSYEVAANETDADGVSVAANALSLNGGTIRDSANRAAGLTHSALAADVNHRVDGVKPMLLEAVVDETILTLTYDEPLAQPALRASSFITVAVVHPGRGTYAPEVAVKGSVMTVTLSGPVLAGEVVTVRSNVLFLGAPHLIRDLAGNPAASLMDHEVTNVTKVRPYDTDGDRLIEITTLAQLDAVRHDRNGDGVPTGGGASAYRAAFPDAFVEAGSQLRCVLECQGYELMADLDFDTDDDGDVDADDNYWNNGAGWNPIGRAGSDFLTTFEGNGHTVRNLFIGRPSTNGTGLFGYTDRASDIRHVGLIQVDVAGRWYVGGLVGNNLGAITASYATGQVSGYTRVGGLVGANYGSVRTSHATAQVSGSQSVGGLVGRNLGDAITVASYATGAVSGIGAVGGLIGYEGGNTVRASYASGRVSGLEAIGGLVGALGSSTITASYWDTTTSGQTTGDHGTGQTTAQLQAPTDDTGIYAAWDYDLWDFGEADEYPVLAVDFDGDGDATWEEFGYQFRERPGLTATFEPTGVTLTWTEVHADHWDPAPDVAYTLYRDDGTEVTTLAENSSGRSYTDTSTVVGATYTYQVAAVVDGGEATRSARVSVTVPDSTPPTVSMIAISSNPGTDAAYATGDEIQVTVTFSETVEVTGTPRLTLELGGGRRTATYGGGSGTAALLFAYEVADGESDTDGVGVEADSLLGGTIRDGSNNNAVLDHETVAPQAGHKVDAVKPRLAASGGAVVNGTKLTLTYDEPLGGSSTPASGDFTVAGGDQTRTVTWVSVSGSTVVLTLDAGAEHLEAGILVSYTPGDNPIRDVPGNDAEALSREPVTNDTPDTTAPTVRSLDITSNPGSDQTYAAGDEIEVTVTFDETVEVEGTPQLRLRVGTRTRTAGYETGTGAAALVFAYEVADGDDDTDGVSIEAGRIALNGGTIEDEAENAADLAHGAVVANAGHKVDGVRPAFVSAAVDSSSLTLTYREALDEGSRPAPGDFTVQVDGSGRTVSGVSVSDTVVTLTLNPAVVHGDTGIRVSYTPDTNPIRDVVGNDALALSNRSVTNTTGAPNTVPEITTPSAFDVRENQSVARRLAARDTDPGDEVTGWAIMGGADQGQFTITTDTGDLSFRTAPDFEAPGDNEYEVTVEVKSGAGARELEAEQTFTIRVTDEREPPGIPEAPAFSGETADSMTVNWREPDNTGPAITDYDVQYREKGTGRFTDGQHEGPGLSLTLDDLEPGTVYEVQVRATNDEGRSDWSESGEGITVAPLTVQMTSDLPPPVEGPFTVRFSYSEPVTGFSSNGIESGQNPACTDDQNNPVFCDPGIGRLDTVDNRVFTATVTPGTNGVAHNYTLTLTVSGGAVRSSAGNKPNEAATLEVRIAPPGVTAPISTIGLTPSASNGQVTLRWNTPANTGGAPIVRYEYRWKESGGEFSDWISVGSGTRSATVRNLTNGAEYTFEARAVNALGKGSAETAVATPTVVTRPPVTGGGGGGGGGSGPARPPSYPGTIRAGGGDGEVTLTWNAPSSQGSSRIQYYEYRIDGEGEWISTGSSDRIHTIAGLTNGRVYFFHLRAVSAAGSGSHRISPEATPVADLDFTHFANGGFITSTLALVNAGAYPVRPAIYFYDQDGDPIAARSLVSLTPDLEVLDDGAVSPRTVMNPLSELTIATHGRGGQRVGSVSVRAPSSIGGVLRFDIPALGVAGVGDSATLRDALVPVRRQDDGINTGVAVRNRGTAALTLQCRLMRDGAVLEETIIPLAANGQDSRFIDQVFPAADTSDFAGSVRCLTPEPGRFSAVAFELDGVHRIFTTLPVVPVPAVPEQEQGEDQEQEEEQDATRLDFTHFANGGNIVSDLVLVNAGADPVQPAIYFNDQDGNPIAAESLVDITEDLEVGGDGALRPGAAMNPLGELTISTHGRGGQIVGSVAVVAEGPIGGVLRFDIPRLGVAGVGDSPPVRDALVPVRRQRDGINTGVAVHNRGTTALLVRCRLMRVGVVLEETMIPLAANGQDSRFIDQVFPTADTSDFVGSVRCLTPEPGRFSAVAFELDGVHRIFTTLPVVPVVEVP